MQLKCPKCQYPTNHPFGLIISRQECSGCITHNEKDQFNWEIKGFELEQLVKKFSKKRRKYDCVVPVIGDAEDFFTLSIVLSLGLSPLVVCVNDYFKNDIGWKNLHQLITFFDVDSFVFNPDIRVYKDLVRTSLRKFDHILLPFLQLHTSFPVHIAYERKIPLIIWGQNQAVEQVGKFSHDDFVEMSRWSRREHDLFNTEVDLLVGNGAQVRERYLNYYSYPKTNLLSRRGIRGIYLSNYIRWDPLSQNKQTINFGFSPEKNNSSFDIYERAGSSVYYNIHDLLKYKRIGYKKITDHVAREIRHKRISSNEGIGLISKYNKQKIYIKDFFDWLDVTNSGYEWFKIHRLSGLGNLITEDRLEAREIDLPKKLKDMLSNSKRSSTNFIKFEKGI